MGFVLKNAFQVIIIPMEQLKNAKNVLKIHLIFMLTKIDV